MVSTTVILMILAATTTSFEFVKAHGYVEIPKSEFKNKATSGWIVQIDPQWPGDWDNVKKKNGEKNRDAELVSIFKELKESNNANDIRTFLDSDTNLYGADCGYTDPDAKPKDPPKDGTAKFSRGIAHAGPCEIWLDDKMVLQNDDCQGAFGDGSIEYTTIFKPIDYSSCASGGCMMRFYWIALQGIDNKIVWQIYKNCIPLSGPAKGGISNSTNSTEDGSNPSQNSNHSQDKPASKDSDDSNPSQNKPENKDLDDSKDKPDNKDSDDSKDKPDNKDSDESNPSQNKPESKDSDDSNSSKDKSASKKSDD